MKNRVLSFSLRILGLILKLCLTLYMGRYLTLECFGTYGLVAAFAVISISIIGFRLDYVATREVINLRGLSLTAKIRDQYLFFGICSILFGITVYLYYCLNDGSKDKTVYLFIVILGVLESFSSLGSANLVALQKPTTANLLFFIRSSLWIPPAIFLGAQFEEYRNEQVIFVFWVGGLITSLFINGWVWRKMPWKQSLTIPVDWKWIKTSLFKAFPIWLGTIFLACSGFVDRFVVETFLDRASVGIISFYSSFAVAVYNLMNSGIFSFTYPKLVKSWSSNNPLKFKEVTMRMRNQAFLAASSLCLITATVVPILSSWFEKKELLNYISILWGMLFGVWMRCITEYIYYICYAKEKDKLIWIGNFIFVFSSMLFNIIFISCLGLSGALFGAIMSVVPFCIWRIYCLKKI